MTKDKGTNPKPGKAGRPVHVDWEAVERDYRLGRFTNVELAARHQVAATSISRRIAADKEKDPTRWCLDLRSQVRAATAALLIAEKVKEGVKNGQDASQVLAAASSAKDVLIGHQRDVRSLKSLAAKLLTELEAATDGQGEASTMHLRVASAQKLADTMAKLQAIERKAHGIADEGDASTPGEDLTDEQLDAQIEARLATVMKAGG